MNCEESLISGQIPPGHGPWDSSNYSGMPWGWVSPTHLETSALSHSNACLITAGVAYCIPEIIRVSVVKENNRRIHYLYDVDGIGFGKTCFEVIEAGLGSYDLQNYFLSSCVEVRLSLAGFNSTNWMDKTVLQVLRRQRPKVVNDLLFSKEDHNGRMKVTAAIQEIFSRGRDDRELTCFQSNYFGRPWAESYDEWVRKPPLFINGEYTQFFWDLRIVQTSDWPWHLASAFVENENSKLELVLYDKVERIGMPSVSLRERVAAGRIKFKTEMFLQASLSNTILDREEESLPPQSAYDVMNAGPRDDVLDELYVASTYAREVARTSSKKKSKG